MALERASRGRAGSLPEAQRVKFSSASIEECLVFGACGDGISFIPCLCDNKDCTTAKLAATPAYKQREIACYGQSVTDHKGMEEFTLWEKPLGQEGGALLS